MIQDFRPIWMLLAAFLITLPLTANGWELAKKSDGIEVFTRLPKDSDFKAFYAVTHLKAPLRQLVAMGLHIGTQTDWIQDCEKSELLKHISDNQYYAYYVTYAPWPVENRDYVLHAEVTRDSKSHAVTIHFRAVNGIKKPTSDNVRAAKVVGFWRFTPERDQQVKVEYQVEANPGGWVPAWLANSFVVNQPFETLQKMRRHMNDPVYKTAAVPLLDASAP